MKYVISWPIEPSLPTMPDGTGKDRLTGVSRLYDADGGHERGSVNRDRGLRRWLMSWWLRASP